MLRRYFMSSLIVVSFDVLVFWVYIFLFETEYCSYLSAKESWLLNGLVDYYIASGSMRCVDILVGVREPHDKYLFDRLVFSSRLMMPKSE